MEFSIRQARKEDMGEIFALERRVAEAPHWTLEEYAAIPEAGEGGAVRRCLLVAEGTDVPARGLVGFAVGKVVGIGDASFGELESVVVAEEARRQGLGWALCERVLAWCRAEGADTVELEVRSLNESALELYRRLGFVEQGVRRGYYRAPADDALLMRVRLPRP